MKPGAGRTLLRRLAVAAAVIGAVFAGAAWIVTAPRAPYRAGDPQLDAGGDPAHGQSIFALGDCASCHATPGQDDRLRLGGGLALSSPYGVFRPPNISPDPVDGIGSWTTADLANALLAGVSPQRAHYYPVFPYPNYTAMRLEDVRDLMAYLRTLPPVGGRAPDNDLVWLFSIRRFVGFWKLLYFHPRQADFQPSGDPIRDRGAYLVEAISHCAECHSSRDIFGGIKPKTRFAGGIDPSGVGFVPNITPAGIGAWSERQIAEMLKTGWTPDHGRVGSSMAAVVTNTAMLPQADRDAIARYIKSLPPRETPRP